ncbi:PREDICTED: beta-defensin 118-like [Galeopterus variegatus]|uniref:Beta-defensin n=1 Tax=Galeopterus variegatus TaxID=482537 RepID=A0ABM0SJM1_GALVR|nr:PREDICTED: beta-defensin 118-like [Galeopterus variegatus]
MRLLLLALPVLAFLPQVIPAFSGENKCWNKLGHCRKRCKDGEVIREVCKNHRFCCVRNHQVWVTTNKVPEQAPETTSEPAYDLSTGIIDVIITIEPSVTYSEEIGPDVSYEESFLSQLLHVGLEVIESWIHRSISLTKS